MKRAQKIPARQWIIFCLWYSFFRDIRIFRGPSCTVGIILYSILTGYTENVNIGRARGFWYTMSMKKILCRIVLGALLAGLLFLIFGASFQSGEESSSLSAWASDIINNALAGTGLSISEHFVRKAAHFCEYAALGVLLFLNRRAWRDAVTIVFPWLLFIGLLIPALDEFLQYFRPGRGSMVGDVLLDFSGVVAGLALCSLAGRLFGKR